MRAFFEALDRAEPWAVFWSAVVWVAVMVIGYAVLRTQYEEQDQRYRARTRRAP